MLKLIFILYIFCLKINIGLVVFIIIIGCFVNSVNSMLYVEVVKIIFVILSSLFVLFFKRFLNVMFVVKKVK